MPGSFLHLEDWELPFVTLKDNIACLGCHLILNIILPGGLAADLRQLCCCSYLGHVAPGSSPGTGKRHKNNKKITKQRKWKYSYIFGYNSVMENFSGCNKIDNRDYWQINNNVSVLNSDMTGMSYLGLFIWTYLNIKEQSWWSQWSGRQRGWSSWQRAPRLPS